MSIEVNTCASNLAARLRITDLWREAVTVKPSEHPTTGSVIDVDGDHVIGQFVLWPTGAIEASALAIEDGEQFYFDSGSDLDLGGVEERWTQFVSAISKVEANPPLH